MDKGGEKVADEKNGTHAENLDLEKEKMIDDEQWSDFWRKKAEYEEAVKFKNKK